MTPWRYGFINNRFAVSKSKRNKYEVNNGQTFENINHNMNTYVENVDSTEDHDYYRSLYKV